MATASLSLGNAPVMAQPAAVLVTRAPVTVAPGTAALATQPDPNQPWPPVLQTPIGQTVCNYISYCRKYHTWGFILYGLILIAVIVVVWLGKNGTWGLTLFNTAVIITVLIAVLIVLMFLHWYFFIKGVIPECVEAPFSISGSITANAGARAAVATAPAPVVVAAAPAVVAAQAPVVVAAAPAVVVATTPAPAVEKQGGGGTAAQSSYRFPIRSYYQNPPF